MKKTIFFAAIFLICIGMVGIQENAKATDFPDGTITIVTGTHTTNTSAPVVTQSTSTPNIQLNEDLANTIYVDVTYLCTVNLTVSANNTTSVVFNYTLPNSGTTLVAGSTATIAGTSVGTVTNSPTGYLTFTYNCTTNENYANLIITFAIDNILSVTGYIYHLEAEDDGYSYCEAKITNNDGALAVDSIRMDYTYWSADGLIGSWLEDGTEVYNSVTDSASSGVEAQYTVGTVAASGTETHFIQEELRGDLRELKKTDGFDFNSDWIIIGIFGIVAIVVLKKIF